MTEKEAIKWQEAFRKTYNEFPKEASEACDMAISALEEIQQYRALGTLEELQNIIAGPNLQQTVYNICAEGIEFRAVVGSCSALISDFKSL